MGGSERGPEIAPGTRYRPLVLVLLTAMAVSGMVTLATLAIGANESILIARTVIFGTALILLEIAIALSRIHQRDADELLKAPWTQWSSCEHEGEIFAANTWADRRRDARYAALRGLRLGVHIGVIGTAFIGDLPVSGITIAAQG